MLKFRLNSEHQGYKSDKISSEDRGTYTLSGGTWRILENPSMSNVSPDKWRFTLGKTSEDIYIVGINAPKAGFNMEMWCIHHDGSQKVASYGMPVRSLMWVFRRLNRLYRPAVQVYFNMWGMKSWHDPKSETSPRFFRRDAGWEFCQLNRTCRSEIFSTQHQPVIPRIESSLIRPR